MELKSIVVRKDSFAGRNLLVPVSEEAKFLCKIGKSACVAPSMITVLEEFGVRIDYAQEKKEKKYTKSNV